MPLSNRVARFIGLGAVLALNNALATHAPGASVATDNPHRSPLDLAVDTAAADYFRNTCHVGLSIVAVTPQGRFFYDYGSTELHGHVLPNRRNIYEIASVTKTFTGALAARAVEQGKMRVDADFRSFLQAPTPILHGRASR